MASKIEIQGDSALTHLAERHGKVNFRLTKSNAAKLKKVAEELTLPSMPSYPIRRPTRGRVLTHVLNQFLKSFDEKPKTLFELVENRRRGTKICLHLDLRLRYAVWKLSRILKVTQNELINLAIEYYPLRSGLPENTQGKSKR